ncbi:cysteine peptidase family C39 domain-containing protein [Zongyangia hominis]|uniref:C39 family peptidase n=1 Tax=Zongyangia hominis TaxID=2763677 RepID=A0A926IBN3_9FIRM|nr:cysteine peptidase family C39 domain-containing protein [Zongyangia hominis]MBC8570362.1 C39 family peptidase [Zongyangia hominis]
MKKIVIAVLSVLLLAGIGTAAYLLLRPEPEPMPFPQLIKVPQFPEDRAGTYPPAYQITGENFIYHQGENQCAGYSGAYLLRHLGQEVDGPALDERLARLSPQTGVMPERLVRVLGEYDVKAAAYRGTLESLKTRVAEGVPVIVLIGEGAAWQHYAPVTGYDGEHIYLADPSGEETGEDYNSILTTAEFLDQWDNGLPGYANLYIITKGTEKTA